MDELPPPPLPLYLTAEERSWYIWLTRELVNAARLLCDDGCTLDRILDALDELVDELLGRIPDG